MRERILFYIIQRYILNLLNSAWHIVSAQYGDKNSWGEKNYS